MSELEKTLGYVVHKSLKHSDDVTELVEGVLVDNLEEAILTWHKAELARVIGEDEWQEVPFDVRGFSEDPRYRAKNQLRADQRERAGL